MEIELSGLLQQISSEFDRLRWSASGEVRLGIYHQATNAELDGFPWQEQAAAMETIAHREFVQFADENGSPRFRDTPVLDAAGNPIVNSAGQAFDVQMPAHRGLFLYGDPKDVSRLRSIVSRAGKVLLHERTKLDIDFGRAWRFASEAGFYWSVVFEIAWSKNHPLLAADKRLFVKSANCSYPYDIEAIRRMRSSKFGDFSDALPAEWEKELPDAWVSTIDEGIAACCDVWASLSRPQNTQTISVLRPHESQAASDNASEVSETVAMASSESALPQPLSRSKLQCQKDFILQCRSPGQLEAESYRLSNC